jgi:uncharacterized membrane protein
VQKKLAGYLTGAALLWVAAILAAPYAIASHNAALVGIATLIYQGAGLICHQRPERSFHLEGVQLPVCGRCLGLYVSGAIGALAAWFVSGRVAPRGTRFAIFAAAVPTAVTVSLEFLGLIHPGNVLRAVSALPLGATAAWIFVRSLRAEAGADPPRTCDIMR